MSRKVPPIDLDNLTSRYLAGESASELATSFNVSRSYVEKRLRDAGVTRTVAEAAAFRARNKPKPAWHAEAIRLWEQGDLTQEEIGKRLGYKQASVSKVLLAAGFTTDRSAAAVKRAARMTDEEIQALVSNAHEAVRGMTRTKADLEKRARTKQRTQAHATNTERALARSVRALGHEVVLQQSVTKYNLDLGVDGAVAVEVQGGNWHSYGRHGARLFQRTMDVVDAGWNIYFVWTSRQFRLVPRVVAEDVHAFTELTRVDPAFRRQYRVVRGDGQFIAAGCLDDDDVTLVPTGVAGVYAGGRLD